MSDELALDLVAWLRASQPYLEDLIFVGGVAPWFYRAWAKPVGLPLLTTDVDIACENRLPIRTRPLRELLDAEFRIDERRGFGKLHDVYQHFERRRHPEGESPVYFELVTPLVGKGREPPRVEVQPGTPASMLRYVDLLLREPLQLDVGGLLNLGDSLHLRVAHPAAFLVQKSLLSERSGREHKRGGDLGHVVDVARLVRDRTDELSKWLDRNIAASYGKWCRRAHEILLREFGTPTADGAIEVAKLYRGSDPNVDAEFASAIIRELLDRLRLDAR